jgi:hypothetical protein
VPLFPSLVAVIVALPVATAVTTPLLETVAIEGALVAHVTLRPFRIVPFASRTIADSVELPPITILAELGVIATDPTAVNVTAICAVPDFPSAVAVIVVVPAPTAVTRP